MVLTAHLPFILLAWISNCEEEAEEEGELEELEARLAEWRLIGCLCGLLATFTGTDDADGMAADDSFVNADGTRE